MFHVQPPRIRFLGPTLWSVGACCTIYLGCAAYDVHRDAQHIKAKHMPWSHSQTRDTRYTFEDLERFRDRTSTASIGYRIGSTSSERLEFSDPQKLTMGIMGLTAGIHLATNVVPSTLAYVVHVPALSRNYTLLTSTFGHGGLGHLGLNMYGMWCFVPSAARSPVFKESNPHLAAFYLSAGILSSLAQHATSIWPRRNYMSSSLGASGALFAMIGIVGVSFPQTQLGLILVPGSWPIGQVLSCMAIFDAIGIFVKYPYFRLGHAAHLSGLGVGVAYAQYGGDKNIWRPARRLAFNSMRAMGAL